MSPPQQRALTGLLKRQHQLLIRLFAAMARHTNLLDLVGVATPLLP